MKTGLFSPKSRILTGAAIWLIWMAYHRPHPLEPMWASGLLLLAMFVVVPLCLDLLAHNALVPSTLYGFLVKCLLPAAFAAAFAFSLPAGWISAILVLPWFLVTLVLAQCGLKALTKGAWKQGDKFCFSLGMVYLAVAGLWAVLERAGARPLGYSPEIVFLTIVHFHYAGFVLPVATGLAIHRTGQKNFRFLGYAVVGGVALVAAGIVLSQLGYGPDWEGASAWWMALSATFAGALHLYLAIFKEKMLKVRLLWVASGACLLGGMLLAGLYGTRYLAPVEGLDIPTMRAVHGTLNAMGFGLFAIWGWWLQSGLETRHQ